MNETRNDLSASPVTEWPDVVLGLWLRSLWLGSAFAIMGAVMLVAGEPHPGIGLTLLVAGGAFARYSWVRARTLLNALDAPVRNPAPAVLPARAMGPAEPRSSAA